MIRNLKLTKFRSTNWKCLALVLSLFTLNVRLMSVFSTVFRAETRFFSGNVRLFVSFRIFA